MHFSSKNLAAIHMWNQRVASQDNHGSLHPPTWTYTCFAFFQHSPKPTRYTPCHPCSRAHLGPARRLTGPSWQPPAAFWQQRRLRLGVLGGQGCAAVPHRACGGRAGTRNDAGALPARLVLARAVVPGKRRVLLWECGEGRVVFEGAGGGEPGIKGQTGHCDWSRDTWSLFRECVGVSLNPAAAYLGMPLLSRAAD